MYIGVGYPKGKVSHLAPPTLTGKFSLKAKTLSARRGRLGLGGAGSCEQPALVLGSFDCTDKSFCPFEIATADLKVDCGAARGD